MLFSGKVRKIFVVFFSVFLISSLVCGDVFAARSKRKKRKKWTKSKYGLGALMDLSSGRNKMKKVYKKETEAYEKIDRGISYGLVKKGMTAAEIEKRYGGPIMVLEEEGKGISKWVYKPATDSYFGGKKAYLFFDDSNELINWELIPKTP